MKARSMGARDVASLGLNMNSRAPRAKHLEDEETSRDLFGVVRSFCTKCPCKQYVKRTEEYTVKPGEVGRLHPHNDPGIINCSVCGCPPEAHAVDGAMNEKEQGNDSFELGRYDEAILAYTRGITQKPHDEMLWSNRAAAYLRKGMYDQALHDASRAVEISPWWVKARARKAGAHFHLRQYESAVKEYQMCVKLDPAASLEYAEALKLAKRKAAAVKVKAEATKRKKKSSELEHHQTLLQRNPKKMGDERMKEGRYNDAIAFYSQALAQDKRDHKVYSNRSAAFAKMQRYQEALQDALASIKIAPAWAKAWSRKGLALYYLGSLEEAISSYEQCLCLDPSNKEVRKFLTQLKASHPHKKQQQQQEEERTSSKPPPSSVPAKEDDSSQEPRSTSGRDLDTAAASLHQKSSPTNKESLALVQQSLDNLHKLMREFDTKLNAQAESISRVLERVVQVEERVNRIQSHFPKLLSPPVSATDEEEALTESSDNDSYGGGDKQNSRSELDHDSDSFHVVGPEDEHLEIDLASVSSQQSIESKGEEEEVDDSQKDNDLLPLDGITTLQEEEMFRCIVCTDEIVGEENTTSDSNESNEDDEVVDSKQPEDESASPSPAMTSVHPHWADPPSALDTENEPSGEIAFSGSDSAGAPCESSGEREEEEESTFPSKKTRGGSSFKVRADDLLELFQSTEKGRGGGEKKAKNVEAFVHPVRVEEEILPEKKNGGLGGPTQQECPTEEERTYTESNGKGDCWDHGNHGFSSFNQNEKDDARKVFEDVWNTLDEEEEENTQEESSAVEDGDEEQRWFDLQEEWTRVKAFCDQNRDVIQPPFRQKRPLHETAKAVQGVSREEAVLDITNLSQSFSKVSSQKTLQRDWFGVLRGACKTCGPAICPIFRPSYQGSPAPQRLFERAVEEKRNDLMELAIQWNSLPPGKYCASCGCPSNEHETEQEYEKRLRIDAILKRKQDDIKKSKASEQREEENLRQKRVKEAVFRQKEAETSGEYIRETSLDFITQVKRGPCVKSRDCPGFKVIFRESDALNPDIMLYCSLCGYPSGDHPIDTNWESEQRRKKERENRRFNQDYYRFRSNNRSRRGGGASPYNEVRRSACAILGVSVDATATQISRAYKKKALKWHPDKNSSPKAQELFVRMTHAFQLLQKKA